MRLRDHLGRFVDAARSEARRAAHEAFGAAADDPRAWTQMLRPRVAEVPGLRWLEPVVALVAAGGVFALALTAGAALLALMLAFAGIWLILKLVFGVDVQLDPSRL